MGQDDITDGRRMQSEEGTPAKDAVYRNADKALEFLNHDEPDSESFAVDEKALVRKIDWMIVPIMLTCYFLQYLDKSLRKCISMPILKCKT
jgi:hypothetical protein